MEPIKTPLSIPAEISESLSRFQSDHTDPQRVAFVMMRFQSTDAHKYITDAIRSALTVYGINALRADDREYHTDVYWNILTYVYGCGFGIAVFERIEEESFNPNISFEVGYMLALGKPVCLLKERTLRTLHTDLIGKLYRVFDGQNPQSSLTEPLHKWLADQNSGLPIEQTLQWVDELNRRPNYRKWSFRVNWPLAVTGHRVDAYSRKTTCQGFIKVLMSTRITRQEFDSVLDAIKRATSNEIPPQKLSGEILFSETSKAVLDEVQCLLGSTPYERPKERHEVWNDVLGEPEDVFPPSHLFSIEVNIEKYKSAQKSIAITASQICKNVLCSIYQISISKAIYWKDEHEKNTLAMICTARSSKKENIPIVSEIPLVMGSREDKFSWFGQPERRPTTEYQSHWCFHKTLFERGMLEHILIHFHPVALLEAFESLQAQFQGVIPEKTWHLAVEYAKNKGINLTIFTNYMQTGARHPDFGKFIADTLEQRSDADDFTNVIWKPDHGLWLVMSSSKDIAETRKALENIEILLGAIAKVLTNSDCGNRTS